MVHQQHDHLYVMLYYSTHPMLKLLFFWHASKAEEESKKGKFLKVIVEDFSNSKTISKNLFTNSHTSLIYQVICSVLPKHACSLKPDYLEHLCTNSAGVEGVFRIQSAEFRGIYWQICYTVFIKMFSSVYHQLKMRIMFFHCLRMTCFYLYMEQDLFHGVCHVVLQ